MDSKNSVAIQVNELDNQNRLSLTSKKKWDAAGYDGKSGLHRLFRFDSVAEQCDPSWLGAFNDNYDDNDGKKPKVRKVRFVVCSLALVSLLLCMMSRSVLNMSVIKMVEKRAESNENNDKTCPAWGGDSKKPSNNDDNNKDPESSSSQSTPVVKNKLLDLIIIAKDDANASDNNNKLKWTEAQVTWLLGAFSFGYLPVMLVSGRIAETHGSKSLLQMTVLGSSLVNVLTPFLAHQSYLGLFAARILMGAFQGPAVPSLYELFNKWLTASEISIFAPMVKVYISAGVLVGFLLSGVIEALSFEWPAAFYAASCMCGAWSLAWHLVASSTPQVNKLIDELELERIIRKKRPKLTPVAQTKQASSDKKEAAVTVIEAVKQQHSSLSKLQALEERPTMTDDATTTNQLQSKSAPSAATPWRLILTNPTVIALTIAKLTYNMGLDFFVLYSPRYLSDIHHVPMKTITLITSVPLLMHILLITLVGWLAKDLIGRQAFGLSRTKWRKVFQGTAHLGIALSFVLLIAGGCQLSIIVLALYLINFTWMLGAGGESLLPYDLSANYSATIMGVAHSLSVTSVGWLTLITTIMLGGPTHDISEWNSLFAVICGMELFGGIVFVLMVRAKPFLPDEKQLRTPTLSTLNNNSNIDETTNTSHKLI